MTKNSKTGEATKGCHLASSSSSTMDHDDETSHSKTAQIKSAEDRKTAADLSSIDDNSRDDYDGTQGKSNVDQEAVRKAMEKLGDGAGSTDENTNSVSGKKEKSNNGILPTTKSVKFDASDVNLIVEELEITKVKATSLLKSFGGDVQKTLSSYINSD